jgi:hypothetical protein
MTTGLFLLVSEASPKEEDHEGKEQPEEGGGEEEQQEVLRRKGQAGDHGHGHETPAPQDGEEDRAGLELHGLSTR